MKKKIQEAFQKQFEEKKKSMKKLRFLNSKATQTYLQQLTNQTARMALIIRLNMFESMTHNFGVRKNCSLCGNKNDTTEHAFDCPSRINKHLVISDLQEGNKMDEIVELFLNIENQKRSVLIADIITNFEVIQREVWIENKVQTKGNTEEVKQINIKQANKQTNN